MEYALLVYDDGVYDCRHKKSIKKFQSNKHVSVKWNGAFIRATLLYFGDKETCISLKTNITKKLPRVVLQPLETSDQYLGNNSFDVDQTNDFGHTQTSDVLQHLEATEQYLGRDNFETNQSVDIGDKQIIGVSDDLDGTFVICSNCSYLVANIDIHLTVCENRNDNNNKENEATHNLLKMLESTNTDEEDVIEENYLCMYCGILCIDLNDHLQSTHDIESEMLEVNVDQTRIEKKPKKYPSKQHYCIYCHKLHFKLARHMETKHREEKDVQEATKYKKGSSQRRILFIEIQKKGDFLYSQNNEIINMRRNHSNSNSSYLACPYCKGYYSKKNLRNHVRLNCLAKTDKKKHEFEEKGLVNLITSSRSLLPKIIENANDALKTRIFPTMKHDEITKVAACDWLAVQFGNYLTTKYGSSRHHDKMIKNKLRHLSRLFIEMKKISNKITDFSSIFDSENFDTFITAVYAIAGLKDGKYENPSVGPSSVTLILQVGAILETEAIKNKNHNLELETKRFCKLVKTQCSSLINKMALENRTQQQRAKVIVLPKTSDIRDLGEHLEYELKHHMESLKKVFCYTDWMSLNKIVLIKIMTFNRKRPGDVEKSQIVEYRNLEIVSEDEMCHLQDGDKYIGISYGRYITRGKLDRPAAVLLSKNEMDAIELILKYRTNANVDKDNPYLFATPASSAEQFIRAGKALSDFCCEKGMEGKNLTATKMRKHLATVTSNLDKEEQVRVSDFMGHSFNIHQNIYRQRPASQDIVGMSKILNFAGGLMDDRRSSLPRPVQSAASSGSSLHSIISSSNIWTPTTCEASLEPYETSLGINRELSVLCTPESSTSNRQQSPMHVTPYQSGSSDEEVTYDKNYTPDLSNILEDDEDTSDEEPRRKKLNIGGKRKRRSKSISLKPYMVTKKTRWTTPERTSVKQLFKNYFTENNNDIPSLETCQDFAFQNPVLSSRSPSQIRAWIVQQKKRLKTREGSDYLNVAIKDGCLSLTMGLANGKQEMQIKPNKVRFDDNQWHKVSVHRRIQEISAITSFCRLSAVVDGVYADHSHIAGKFTMLSSSRVYVGGSINTRALPGARVHNNFVGCMRKVEFVADTLRLNLLELGRSGSHLIQVAGRLDYKCPTGETHDPITFTTRESHLIIPPWNAKKSGNISFKFRTNEANGLILFNGGIRPPRVDLFAVEIYNGHIYVHLDLGSGPSKQRGSRRRIDDGAWHEVTFRRTGRDARITVDGFHTDFKTIEGSTSLELDGNMYVGGLGPPFSEIPVPAGLWTAVLQQGFVGCFKDLVMNNEAVDVASYAREQDSGSIRTLCHTQPQQCPSQPCLNGGTCTEGWNRFICDCTSTLFSGPTCGKEAPTLSFNGTQHMEVTMDSEMTTQTEDIILRFRTSKPLGLLLITSTVETGDRIELAVAAGRIRLAVRLGVKEKKKEDKEKDKILLAGQNVNDNEFHTVRISRRGSNLKLQLDNQSPLRAEIQGKFNALQWRTIHLGGLYHLEEEISMSTTVPNFIGDIQQFYFNNIPYIELARALSTEQSISGFPNIKVVAKFVKHATDNLHRPVTFRSKHTFIGLPMLRAYSSIHIDFMFKTREANGLIMFNGGKKEDFVAVELVDGHINYVVNVGDGTVTLRDTVRSHLNDNRWHTVGIRRPSAKQHTLMVDDDIVVAANFGTGNLELDGILYLGGVYKDLYAQLPQDDVKSRHGFEGCIAGLDLNGESPNIMEDAVVHSSLVTAGCEGQSAKCSHNVCANAGICVQQWNAYTCDCDMTSFTGPTCSDESVSYEFGPNRGIITYTFPEDNRPEMQEDTIAIGFITTKSDAVLLRIVSGTSNDYIEMYIVEGNVFAVYNLGTNDHPLGEISVKVNDNAYHVVRFHRQGHNSTLQVDDYNVQSNHPSGHQLQVFNSQSQIQIGGKWSKKGRIERPFTGIISGVVVDGLRILDLAAEKDIHASIRGDVQLISGILDRHDHLQKMQQTPASGFPGIEDDLVFSGAGSGCNGDDEDECPPLPETGSGDDDLITPVYVPPTRPPPTKTPKKNGKDEEKPCDDEDCFHGSGSGEVTEEPTTTRITDVTDSILITADNVSLRPSEEISTVTSHTTVSSNISVISTTSNEIEEDTTTVLHTTTKPDTPTSFISTTDTTTTTTERVTIHPQIIQRQHPPDALPPNGGGYSIPNPRPRPPERVSSETSEIIALIIGIIAGALIAVILIILVILKFKSRGDRSFKVDDSKGYQQGPNAALLGNTSSTNGQTQYQLNGALRNGDKSQMQKSKKRDSKDIKEWYV